MRGPTAIALTLVFLLGGCPIGAVLCLGADKELEERNDPFERIECPEGFSPHREETWCSSSTDCEARPGERTYCEEGSCLICRPD
ncbi:MAG: hypothetical protein P1V51_09550 [Deltaproteobacteria bacterium]|nr:hypothetical protein [Deltaproteobacteria bacterium]